MSIRTLAADGTKLKGPAITPLAIREPIPQLLKDMGDRKGVVGLRPLVGEEVDGNPDRRALAVQPAAAVGAAGEVEGDLNNAG
jgi:hypothetical protein